jgi:hypothetical protein
MWFGSLIRFIAHLYNSLLHFTNHWHTQVSVLSLLESSLAVARQMLSSAEISLPLGFRRIPSFNYQLLTATTELQLRNSLIHQHFTNSTTKIILLMTSRHGQFRKQYRFRVSVQLLLSRLFSEPLPSNCSTCHSISKNVNSVFNINSEHWLLVLSNLRQYKYLEPITVALQSKARLRSLGHCGRGFESHLRNGCLCAFILFVLFCV